MKVGDLLWHRNGTSEAITGETKVSWIVGESSWAQEKISKKTLRDTGTDGKHRPMFFATEKMADEVRFAEKNRYAIGNQVQQICDPLILRQIAVLIGYEEKKR